MSFYARIALNLILFRDCFVDKNKPQYATLHARLRWNEWSVSVKLTKWRNPSEWVQQKDEFIDWFRPGSKRALTRSSFNV